MTHRPVTDTDPRRRVAEGYMHERCYPKYIQAVSRGRALKVRARGRVGTTARVSVRVITVTTAVRTSVGVRARWG